ncbi:MAG: type I pullulanase [Clostridia bacterium]|nr:type I pullulanase [Clostridia bacterium]
MKKLLTLSISLLLIAAMLCGCASSNADTSGSTSTIAPTEATPTYADYTLEPEEGKNQLTFFWHANYVDYSKCDMWIWFPGGDGRGYVFHECEYGAKVIINVPESVGEVGFIVRKNCSDPGGTSWGNATKDYEDDRFAVITGKSTEIYLKGGDGGQYYSSDGGKTLTQLRKFNIAAITDTDKIQYSITPAAKFTSLDQIKVEQGGRNIPIASLSSLNNNVALGVITLSEPIDPCESYTVSLDGYGTLPAVPTKIFDSEAFVSKYTYDGNDLGVTLSDGAATFKLWAPTASKVVLDLYSAGNGVDAYSNIEMEKGERGVWSATVQCGHGTYYTYTVTTALGTQTAVDPYARAVGLNGERGMVVDLDLTDPEGFDSDTFYQDIDSYGDAVIWEVHVRDFSNKIEGSAYKGKYLAFTETGLKNSSGQPVGIDYLVDLGITHVHFQPIYDFATVDESGSGALFNWGYDPKNYNAPEGSYSTDPYHGEVRINELKRLVQSLHANGIGVIMDVVYNHTYDINSNLNKIVPYYYYRYDGMGAPSNGSGCGNETASERKMFSKYMVDSVSYWAEEYHIDGFRFDLMALHDIDTMQNVERAVHTINPKAMIYGEGWTGGTSTLRENLRATQANISQIKPTGDAIGSVAVFNDAIRDGLKGSVFDQKDKGYISGAQNASNAGKVAFGIYGGIRNFELSGGKRNAVVSWGVSDDMIINYMSCHDNNTLWDKLYASVPDASDEERFLMNRLGASILMISKGTPFFLAGEEMLRTKQGDTNSYASSDEVNNLDWEALKDGSLCAEMRDFYRALIKMRKENAIIFSADIECEIRSDNSIALRYVDGEKTVAVAVINPSADEMSYDLGGGEFSVLVSGGDVDLNGSGVVSGVVSVPGKGILFVKAK